MYIYMYMYNAIKSIISICLGFGLALLFKQSCQNGKCLRFSTSNISDIDKKVYKFDDKCYRYDLSPASYNENKKHVFIS
jgi:hypothetical protein